jgi:hypothetical protein
MWGGSGSFADSAAAESEQSVQREVYSLLVELRDEFRTHGIEHDRADFWADTFDGWLKDGLFDGERA